MRYARIERERRFMLREIPREIAAERGFRQIEDLYLTGTRLRLRKVLDEEGQVVALKLTQKYREPDMPALHTIITNLYLTQAEYDLFASSPGNNLRKKRYDLISGGRRYAIDIFEGDLEGLILADAEFDSDEEASTLELPSFAIADVTDDSSFTGGALAVRPKGPLPRRSL